MSYNESIADFEENWQFFVNKPVQITVIPNESIVILNKGDVSYQEKKRRSYTTYASATSQYELIFYCHDNGGGLTLDYTRYICPVKHLNSDIHHNLITASAYAVKLGIPLCDPIYSGTPKTVDMIYNVVANSTETDCKFLIRVCDFFITSNIDHFMAYVDQDKAKASLVE